MKVSNQHIVVEVNHEHRERMDDVEKSLEQAGMDIIAKFERTGVFVGLVSCDRLDEIRKTMGVWSVDTGT